MDWVLTQVRKQVTTPVTSVTTAPMAIILAHWSLVWFPQFIVQETVDFSPPPPPSLYYSFWHCEAGQQGKSFLVNTNLISPHPATTVYGVFSNGALPLGSDGQPRTIACVFIGKVQGTISGTPLTNSRGGIPIRGMGLVNLYRVAPIKLIYIHACIFRKQYLQMAFSNILSCCLPLNSLFYPTFPPLKPLFSMAPLAGLALLRGLGCNVINQIATPAPMPSLPAAMSSLPHDGL